MDKAKIGLTGGFVESVPPPSPFVARPDKLTVRVSSSQTGACSALLSFFACIAGEPCRIEVRSLSA